MHSDWTPERHAAAKERCDKASPGEWFWDTYSRVYSTHYSHDAWDEADALVPESFDFASATDEQREEYQLERARAYALDPLVCRVPASAGDSASGRHAADAAFIAMARTDLPDAISEIERLRGLLREARLYDVPDELLARIDAALEGWEP